MKFHVIYMYYRESNACISAMHLYKTATHDLNKFIVRIFLLFSTKPISYNEN